VRIQALGCIQRMLDFVKANPSATQQPGFVRNIGTA
jgi:quinolinate synthase